jgi:hypothetical protein
LRQCAEELAHWPEDKLHGKVPKLHWPEDKLHGKVPKLPWHQDKLRGKVAKVPWHEDKLRGKVAKLPWPEDKLHGKVAKLPWPEDKLHGNVAKVHWPEDKLHGSLPSSPGQRPRALGARGRGRWHLPAPRRPRTREVVMGNIDSDRFKRLLTRCEEVASEPAMTASEGKAGLQGSLIVSSAVAIT